MKEVWKDITEYEGVYQVSNLGRVKSLDRIIINKNGRKRLRKGKILNSLMNKSGYFKVCLYKDNNIKNMYIHQLVAKAFIPNPNNLHEVNHIDEDKSNNVVDNLEWCDRNYNINYGTRNKKVSKSIIMYDKQGNKLKEFNSMLSAERYLNKPNGQSNISACCNGRCKTAYGYIWKYK